MVKETMELSEIMIDEIKLGGANATPMLERSLE